MIIVVTGSRFATEEKHGSIIESTLRWVARESGSYPPLLWEGSAQGVDIISRRVRYRLDWEGRSFAANWAECDPDWTDPIGKAESCPKYPGIQMIHKKARKNGNKYCPIAGFRRNQLMITRALEEWEHRKICVAFPIPERGSHGTEDCLTRAWRAKIPTFVKPLDA